MSFSESLAGNWGTVRIHGKAYAMRQIVSWAGIAVWLILMFRNTGEGGIEALWTAVEFVAVLVLVGSLTRTVSIRLAYWAFLMGGFMMGIAYVGARMAPTDATRDFIVPPMEETLKMIPILWILWRGRKSQIWLMGATDFVLLAAASGAGFGMVEDAYIRHRRGWGGGSLNWLPLTELSGGRLIAGHAIWTALAGVTLGLALLLWNRVKWSRSLAPAGIVLSALDHISNNYGVGSTGPFASFLKGVMADGYLTLYLFLIGVAIAIGFDLYAIHRERPKLPECELPKVKGGMNGLKNQWAFLVDRRALAYVLFRSRGASTLTRGNLLCLATIIDQFLMRRHFSSGTSPAHPPAREPVCNSVRTA
jgi:RsiW-degrading membrane proteinase PrsW (M82 family)